MHKICPLPRYWHETYQHLITAWRNCGRNGFSPPIPLILAGWAHTNDAEKKARWDETVEWAHNNNLDFVWEDLRPDQFYCVAEITTYDVGPGGRPMYLPWSFEARSAPSSNATGEALALLKVTLVTKFARSIGIPFLLLKT